MVRRVREVLRFERERIRLARIQSKISGPIVRIVRKSRIVFSTGSIAPVGIIARSTGV
jgi:hypothetical protein